MLSIVLYAMDLSPPFQCGNHYALKLASDLLYLCHSPRLFTLAKALQKTHVCEIDYLSHLDREIERERDRERKKPQRNRRDSLERKTMLNEGENHK